MSLNPLSANIVDLLSPQLLSNGSSTAKADSSFADILTQAMNTVASTDMTDKASSMALLAGQTDDMAGLIIDSQKAEIALSLALSIRNKVLDAYTEIMRMQV